MAPFFTNDGQPRRDPVTLFWSCVIYYCSLYICVIVHAQIRLPWYENVKEVKCFNGFALLMLDPRFLMDSIYYSVECPNKTGSQN